MKKTTRIAFILSMLFFLYFPTYAQVLSPPGISPNGSVFSMAEKDGILYMGGSFQDVGYLTGGAAFLPNQSEIPDLKFPHINGEVYSIIEDGVGGWYLGGEFDNVDAAPRSNIVHILADKTIDLNFSIEINDKVNALALKDNLLFIGGKFTMVDNVARSYLAAYDIQSATLSSINPSPNQEVKTLEVYKNSLIMGGFFSQIAGESQPRVARIDINTGQNVLIPFPPNGFVYDLLVTGDTLVVGGDFTGCLLSIDLTTNTKINWNAVVSGFGFGQSVNALALVDTVVYFGGSFSKVNNQNRSDLGAVSLKGNLLSFDPGADGKVTSILADGDSLYIGGDFLVISSSALPHLAKISRLTGLPSTWKSEPNWAIHGIAKKGDDLLIGGQINMLHRLERDNACAIDIATGLVTDWNPQPKFLTVSSILVDRFQDVVYLAGWDSNESRNFKAVNILDGVELEAWHNTFDNAVNDIDQDPINGNIYIGGKFTTINGESHSRLAGFKPNGDLFNLNTNIDDEVRNIAFSSDHNMLYFAGKFENVNGQLRSLVAAIDNLGVLQNWSIEIHNNYSDLLLGVFDFIPTKDKIYICGNLNFVNGEERDMIAAIHPTDGSLLPYNPSIESKDIHTMEPAGEGIFIAGTDLVNVGNTAVANLAYIGANSGLALTQHFEPATKAVIHSMLWRDSLLYIAGNFENLGQKFYGHLVSYAIDIASDTLVPPTGTVLIEKTFPEEGGNNGSVTIEIIGAGFAPRTSVKLSGQGFEDILFSPDSSQISENRILANFNLRGVPEGLRVLEVSVPDNQTVLLGGAFRIVEGTEAMPWADVVAPYFVTARKDEFFYLSIGNKGNIDATGVPVWLAVSPNIEIKNIDFKMFDIFDSSSPYYDSIPEFILVDSLAGKANPAKVYGFIIPRIEALSSKVVRFTINGTATGDFYTRAWASRPLYGSPLKYSIGECADTWITNAVGFIPVVGCSFGIADVVLSPIYDYMYDPEFGSSNWAGNYIELVASTGIGCAAEVFTGGFGGAVVHAADQALKAKSTVDLLQKCWPAEDKENGEGEFVASCDPNDKAGLPGRGGKGWISTDKRFPYMIRFENDPEATAPAKQVIIRDTLDTSVFDLAGLQLKGFAIADSFYIIPSGYSEYTMTIDLQPRLPYLVESEVTLNNTSGLLTWTFTTLDPVSKDPVTNPIGGFLPPSIDTLSGQGAIFFDVAVYDTISNGREINNLAYIYFDYNDPIITNNHKLTADNGGPESFVRPLKETQEETDIHLEWSGSDQGSGIIYYDVLFRKNKGEWLYANVQTQETSMRFTGEVDAEYEFFTVAYDSALNQEPAPSQADARVLISNVITGLALDTNEKDLMIYPNPTNSVINLNYAPGIKNPEIQLLSISGQKIMYIEKLRHPFINIQMLTPGLYILKWQEGTSQGQLKLIKN